MNLYRKSRHGHHHVSGAVEHVLFKDAKFFITVFTVAFLASTVQE